MTTTINEIAGNTAKGSDITSRAVEEQSVTTKEIANAEQLSDMVGQFKI